MLGLEGAMRRMSEMAMEVATKEVEGLAREVEGEVGGKEGLARKEGSKITRDFEGIASYMEAQAGGFEGLVSVVKDVERTMEGVERDVEGAERGVGVERNVQSVTSDLEGVERVQRNEKNWDMPSVYIL